MSRAEAFMDTTMRLDRSQGGWLGAFKKMATNPYVIGGTVLLALPGMLGVGLAMVPWAITIGTRHCLVEMKQGLP